jgi:hypothetical protein
MIAEHGARDDFDQHNDPHTMDHARLGPPMRRWLDVSARSDPLNRARPSRVFGYFAFAMKASSVNGLRQRLRRLHAGLFHASAATRKMRHR